MWAGKRKSTRGGEILSPTGSKKLLMPRLKVAQKEFLDQQLDLWNHSHLSDRSCDHRGMAGSARTTARQAGSGGGHTLPLSPPDL